MLCCDLTCCAVRAAGLDHSTGVLLILDFAILALARCVCQAVAITLRARTAGWLSADQSSRLTRLWFVAGIEGRSDCSHESWRLRAYRRRGRRTGPGQLRLKSSRAMQRCDADFRCVSTSNSDSLRISSPSASMHDLSFSSDELLVHNCRGNWQSRKTSAV